MNSSWPIFLGFLALVVAAFAYDANNSAASAGGAPTAVGATTRAAVSVAVAK